MPAVRLLGGVLIFLVCTLGGVFVTRSTAATQVLRLHLTRLDGNGWQVRDVTLELLWRSPEKVEVHFSAASLQLPPPLDQVTGIVLDCRDADLHANTFACQGGTLRLTTPLLDPAPLHVTFRYQRDSGAVQFSLQHNTLAGGKLSLAGAFTQTGWQLQCDANAIQITQLPAQWLAVAKQIIPWPQDMTSAGTVTFQARMSGQGKDVRTIAFDGKLTEFNFTDSAAQRVGERLAMTVALQATTQQHQWQVHADIAAQKGQLYFEPVFVAVPDQPVTLTLSASFHPQDQRLTIAQFRFVHPGVLRAEGQSQVQTHAPTQVLSARLQVAQTPLSGLYQTYIQPFLIGTAFDALTATGQVGLTLDYQRNGATSATISLNDVSLDDQHSRYGLHGLAGTFVWTNAKAKPLPSQLGWHDASVYTITLGASRLALEAHGAGFRLLERVTVPVLDGALQIENARMENAGSPQVQGQFQGRLDAVSMEAFSQALGWPRLSGVLAGTIPQVTYTSGVVQIDGLLQMQVFDGAVTVRNLRLAQPFSRVPQLSADIEMHTLDLALLTRAFSFGKIEGRLNGKIDGLRMEDWKPVAFDAHFATPADDPSPHHINQKAVDNLSSVGGGVKGALSRSFLGFFDEFSYARLGLSCRLARDVCAMDGLEPAANDGYYIVKGGGLPPRIDVIGYVHRVAWTELVERLRRATSNPTPVIR